jgi:oxalate decarboxylase/phosphoglucose isomerase-like protein (cupin superfamily)
MSFLKVTNTSLSSNVWIGRGSITHMHYDASYNCFVQIYGRKKFLIYPPEYWIHLNLYSSLHPSHRQSQMDFPVIPGMTPYEMVLEPGDLLYLPPYWFHHVEASTEDISISVNAWTDCDDYYHFKDISYLPLPIEQEWTKQRQVFRIAEYIKALHQGIVKFPDAMIKETSIHKYLNDYILSRYDRIVVETVFRSNMHCIADVF